MNAVWTAAYSRASNYTTMRQIGSTTMPRNNRGPCRG
jgi:hypothetical protein